MSARPTDGLSSGRCLIFLPSSFSSSSSLDTEDGSDKVCKLMSECFKYQEQYRTAMQMPCSGILHKVVLETGRISFPHLQLCGAAAACTQAAFVRVNEVDQVFSSFRIVNELTDRRAAGHAGRSHLALVNPCLPPDRPSVPPF